MAAADRRIIHGRPFQAETMKKLEIYTIGDLANPDPANFGTAFEKPWKKAMGICQRAG